VQGLEKIIILKLMGEKSKIIGEFGEKTVENFLKLIGWGNAPKNIEFKCVQHDKHGKKSHGLDFFFAYKSPLVDSVLKSVNISVKFTDNPYPNSPNSKFKEYFEDLVTAIECFKNSENISEIISSIKGYSKTEDVGVLFWLSNNEVGDGDIISKVVTAQLNSDNNFHSLFIVDNNRIDFIYKSISFAKSKFQNSDVLFYYPDTGKNLIPTQKQNCGEILPVEFINASILPLRIENRETKKTTLALFSIDSFNLNDLKRLIGLAQDISKSWSSNVLIAFPDFNSLTHMNDIRTAKSSFENAKIISNLEITSFNDNFKSLQTD
jgi:hypothetical protein